MTYEHLLMKNKDRNENSYFLDCQNYVINRTISIEHTDEIIALQYKLEDNIVNYNKVKRFQNEEDDITFFDQDFEPMSLFDFLYDLPKYPIKTVEGQINGMSLTYIGEVFKLINNLFNNNQLFKIVEDIQDNNYSVYDFEYHIFSEDKYSYEKEEVKNFYPCKDDITNEEWMEDQIIYNFVDENIKEENIRQEDLISFSFRESKIKEF